jgi:signal transduction histidine kinase
MHTGDSFSRSVLKHHEEGNCLWRGVLLVGCMLVCLTRNLIAAETPAGDQAAPRAYRLATVPPDAKEGLGAWIWADKTYDHQIGRLWKDFEIPGDAKVTQARLRIAVDDGYQLFLDGRELAQGANWRSITEYDLTLLLPPGHHVLAINAFNDYFAAGMILNLRIELSDGRGLDFKSDETWKVVPEGVRDWEKSKRAQPEWLSATLITPHPFWSSQSWPDDYVRVPAFQPLLIPFWQQRWFYAGIFTLCGVLVLVCGGLVAQLLIQNKEQRLLDLERSRIARDIHDDVGTRLTKLVLQGEIAQSKLPAGSPVGSQFERLCDGLREVLGAMDEVLWAVNPRHDTVANFIAYICHYTEEFLQNTGMQCLMDVEQDLPPLNFELPLRRSLLLVVKEALNNVAKHSGANQVQLKIQCRNSKLMLTVADNGRGFDLKTVKKDRNGLLNFSARMKEAGGECRIVTRPGAGCRVEFTIPLAHRPSRGWVFKRHRGTEARHLFGEAEAAPESEPTPHKSSQA